MGDQPKKNWWWQAWLIFITKLIALIIHLIRLIKAD